MEKNGSNRKKIGFNDRTEFIALKRLEANESGKKQMVNNWKKNCKQLER